MLWQLEDLKNEIEKRQKSTAKHSEEISPLDTKAQGEKSQQSVSEFLQGSFFKGKSPLGMSSPPRPIAWCLNWVFSSHFMPFHQPETPTTMRRWRFAASSFPPPFYPHLSIPSIFTLLQKVLMGSVLRGEIHGWVGRAAVGWICRIHCRAWMLLSWFTFLVEEDPRGPSLVKQFFISMI